MSDEERFGIPKVPGSPELMGEQARVMALTAQALSIVGEVLEAEAPADPERVRAARRTIREALAAAQAMEGRGMEAAGVESLARAMETLVGRAREYLDFADDALTRRGY